VGNKKTRRGFGGEAVTYEEGSGKKSVVRKLCGNILYRDWGKHAKRRQCANTSTAPGNLRRVILKSKIALKEDHGGEERLLLTEQVKLQKKGEKRRKVRI